MGPGLTIYWCAAGPEAGAATPVLLEERTLWQQTQRAAMQFSVIAGGDTWQRTRGT